MSKPLYIFLDEAGNLDFTDKGTEYFILTSLTTFRPFPAYNELVKLRYDLIEYGFNIESFHATEDRQPVRDRVFEVINSKLDEFQIDALIVEKRKTGKALQKDIRFYPEMVGYLLRFVLGKHDLSKYSQVIVVTDTIPLNRKRRAIEGKTKEVLKDCISKGMSFRIMHHNSKSNMCLQIIDYCCWAIFKKWERDDDRSYKLIQEGIKSEFPIFRNGKIKYY
ncbi:MAG: DUF3800 domain-containing protein [Balneolaceae bacterium]